MGKSAKQPRNISRLWLAVDGDGCVSILRTFCPLKDARKRIGQARYTALTSDQRQLRDLVDAGANVVDLH